MVTFGAYEYLFSTVGMTVTLNDLVAVVVKHHAFVIINAVILEVVDVVD